jgi:hypothetical protein
MLEKMYEFYKNASECANWRSPVFQTWFDVFVMFIKAGADPRADMDCPGGGSYARENFHKWDLEKTKRLQRLMNSKQRRLPQIGKKLFSR